MSTLERTELEFEPVACYAGAGKYQATMAEVENIEALLAKLPEDDQAQVKRLIYGGSGTWHSCWAVCSLADSLARDSRPSSASSPLLVQTDFRSLFTVLIQQSY